MHLQVIYSPLFNFFDGQNAFACCIKVHASPFADFRQLFRFWQIREGHLHYTWNNALLGLQGKKEKRMSKRRAENMPERNSFIYCVLSQQVLLIMLIHSEQVFVIPNSFHCLSFLVLFGQSIKTSFFSLYYYVLCRIASAIMLLILCHPWCFRLVQMIVFFPVHLVSPLRYFPLCLEFSSLQLQILVTCPRNFCLFFKSKSWVETVCMESLKWSYWWSFWIQHNKRDEQMKLISCAYLDFCKT